MFGITTENGKKGGFAFYKTVLSFPPELCQTINNICSVSLFVPNVFYVFSSDLLHLNWIPSSKYLFNLLDGYRKNLYRQLLLAFRAPGCSF